MEGKPGASERGGRFCPEERKTIPALQRGSKGADLPRGKLFTLKTPSGRSLVGA